MTVTDILVILAVFGGFALLILSRLKQKNPKRHAAIMGFFKGIGQAKDKIKPNQEVAKSVVLPDSTRIM